MKSNPLLKWLLIPMALALIFVGIKLFSGGQGGKPAPPARPASSRPKR